MYSFFSSLNTERIRGSIYRTRDDAKANLFYYIEHFNNHAKALNDRIPRPCGL